MTKIVLLVAIFSLSACISQIASFKDQTEGLIGGSISEFISVYDAPAVGREKLKGTRRISENDDGTVTYEFPYPKCPLFLVVKEDTIINFYTIDNKSC